LIELLDQLETFVNPYANLVFKGNVYRYLPKPHILEGGSGFLCRDIRCGFGHITPSAAGNGVDFANVQNP
jgi:hypothetical protein